MSVGGVQCLQQARAVSARHPKETQKEINFSFSGGSLSQHVQSRTNLTLFDIAKKAANRFNRPGAVGQISAPTCNFQHLGNFTFQLECPAWIKAQTMGVFFQQALYPFQITVQSS